MSFNNAKIVTSKPNNADNPFFVQQVNIGEFSVQMEIENVVASTDYILIDISDTTNFRHTETTTVILSSIIFNINPSTAFLGDIELGYLKNVDDTNGDFVELFTWHLDQQAANIADRINLFPQVMVCSDAYHLGNTYADDVAFQTDVALTSPAGTSASGNGDIALRIKRTAGNVDLGITVIYTTI